MKYTENLTVGKKISKTFNKVVKRIYLERAKSMGYSIRPNTVLVIGNSNAYANSVVVPIFKFNKCNIVILTQVDEISNLINIYIVDKYSILNNKNVRIVTKELNEYGDKMYFYRIPYSSFEQFNSRSFLRHINKYFINK